MPCFIGCVALAFPRLAVFLVWLLGGDYLGRAYGHWVFPLFGFFLCPLTTLAFAFGMNSLGQPGEMPPLGWLITALAVVSDLGLAKSGGSRADQWRRERSDG